MPERPSEITNSFYFALTILHTEHYILFRPPQCRRKNDELDHCQWRAIKMPGRWSTWYSKELGESWACSDQGTDD